VVYKNIYIVNVASLTPV